MNHCTWIGILCAVALVAPQNSRAEGPATAPATQPSGTAAPQFAVVDLDRVAIDMGWAKEMKENMASAQASLRSDLNRAQAAQEGLLRQKKIDMGLKDTDTDEEIGRKLTQPQQREFVAAINAARQQMSQLQQSATQELQVYQGAWVKQYRDAVSPVVRGVARDRKVLLVLSLPSNVLYAEPSIDLSDEVVRELKARPPVINSVPLPHLPPAGSGTTQPATLPTIAPKGG